MNEEMLFDKTRMKMLKEDHLPYLKRLLDTIDRDYPVFISFTDKKGVKQNIHSFHSTLYFLYLYSSRLLMLLEERK